MKTFVLLMLKESGRFGGPHDGPEFVERHVVAVLQAETAEAAAALIGVTDLRKREPREDPFDSGAWPARYFPLADVWSFIAWKPEEILAKLAGELVPHPVAAVRKFNFNEPIEDRIRCQWLIGEVPALIAAAVS